MKKLLYLLAMLLPLGSSANEKEVPFSVEVDFSKKGTVYETDFQAPWNIWGSSVSFEMWFNREKNSDKYTENEIKNLFELIDNSGTINNIPLAKEKQYFKLKVTLTPLGWASNNITISTIDYSKESWKKYKERFTWRYEKDIWQRKEYPDDKKIEFVVLIPLYGGGGGYSDKLIMTADLQRLRNYHIRVESLEDVELPIDIKTRFKIMNYNRKH